jgi:hypothetical protein
MGKSENKTKPTKVSPAAFLAKVASEQQREDSRELMKLFRELTGKPAKMWGPGIVGFGSYHYVYESGREGDAPMLAFSPRKGALVLYVIHGPKDPRLMAKLGKHKASVACIYVKQLDDIDRAVLKQIAKKSLAEVRRRHPTSQ